MKRLVLAVLTGAAALAALVVIQGCGVLGGPPTGVAVSSGPEESDSTVVIAWTAPAEGGPDKYMVYFRAVADSGYEFIGETTGTSYTHNPHGMTGQYKVTALFGADSYDGAEKPTTIPVHGDTMTLFEINKDSSRCGYGWTRDSGKAGFFAMTDSANHASVDFYVSDLQAGYGHPQYPYSVVSPNKANTIDSGAVGIVPSADWRTNGFTNPLLDEQSPLPGYVPPPSANYFIYTQIPQVPCYVGCYTAGETEKHYALIKVNSVDVASGQVQVESWYQLVPGLRLIRH
jgi:hypothetical protein